MITRIIVLLCFIAASGHAEMVNRWSFNNAAGPAPTGSVIVDSISGTNATVLCGTAAARLGTFTGTALTLPGVTNGNQTPTNISAYVDLPNGIVSSKTNLSVEVWATPVSTRSWQRLFDFGRTNLNGNTAAQGAGAAAGEILPTATSATGTTSSVDDIMLAVNRATAANTQRMAGRIGGATELTADTALTITAGTRYHFVVTFTDGAGSFGSSGGQLAWYLNGALAATRDVNFRLASLSDVNNWLGRSQFSGDSCANISYDELRIYNHAMSAGEIAASFAVGPNLPPPVAVNDAVTMHLGQKVRVGVLANDTGNFTTATVAIVAPPLSGTAVPDGAGNVLYTHTTGAPTSDGFTYRVSGPGGLSAPATVTITFSNSLRIANSTLNVPATPPPLATQLTPVVTGLTQPLCLASPPGDTQRVFFCQKTGLLRVIANITAASPSASTFLDLPTLLTSRGESLSTSGEQGLLGLAFHPSYATNRYFYIFYSVVKSGGTAVYERLSRFSVQAGNPNAADTASELVLIEQLDLATNHNGGDLHFGADGYLYVSLGDGGNQNDSLGNAQKINKDFFSGILRIDVDKKPGSLEPNAHAAVPLDAGVARYSVPVDNPWVHTSLGGTWNGTFNGAAISNLALVRTEFWAVGMRNPWRFSFDPPTGEMWVGDVGQNAYEEVDVVVKGGNYGWAFREANHNGPRAATAPANFDTLYGKAPLYEYAQTSIAGADPNFYGNSVTGGLVYRGTRFPSLAGSYIFADYVSGNVWSLVRNGANPPTVTRIAGEVGIVAFGTDPSNDDVLLADYDNGRILRLTVATVTSSYPATLSATNLFADLTDLSPAPGVLPYAPNLPFWSDYAIKSRWFTIPDGTSTMTWSRDGSWTFPAGQIWVKHFDMEMTRGNPATKKRIETRLLVKNASGVYGVSYQWNPAGTEATLVPDGGAEFDLNLTVNGSPTTQRWHIPSRAECLACHSAPAGGALSFNTRQLNLTNSINGFTANQLTLLQSAGYFSNSPDSPNLLPRHIRPDETSFPVEARARSYLAVNCAYCHQSGGTAPTQWDGRPELTLEQTGLVNGVATNNGGDPANKLLVFGDTAHSIVLNRVAVTNGFTRMPPLASSELDQTNIALLIDWISHQTYANWRLAQFGSSSSPPGESTADPDGDGVSNLMEFAFGMNPMITGTGSLTYSGAVITQRGMPVATIANTTYGVDYRALFGRRKDYVAAGLTYTVQFSADLLTWEDSAATPMVVASDTEMDAVTVPYPFFLSTGAKAQFFRVSVSIQ